MSIELKKLLEHFKKNCNVWVSGTIEDRAFFHWKRLIFEELNCEDMLNISEYIIEYFSEKGKFSHLLPKLHSYQNFMCLTFDVSDIKKRIK